MFGFHLHVVEAGPDPFLGIVEGFPQILVRAASPGLADADLVRALTDQLERAMDTEATKLELDDFPTVRTARLYVGGRST
jgi:hypothetical protein